MQKKRSYKRFLLILTLTLLASPFCQLQADFWGDIGISAGNVVQQIHDDLSGWVYGDPEQAQEIDDRLENLKDRKQQYIQHKQSVNPNEDNWEKLKNLEKELKNYRYQYRSWFASITEPTRLLTPALQNDSSKTRIVSCLKNIAGAGLCGCTTYTLHKLKNNTSTILATVAAGAVTTLCAIRAIQALHTPVIGDELQDIFDACTTLLGTSIKSYRKSDDGNHYHLVETHPTDQEQQLKKQSTENSVVIDKINQVLRLLQQRKRAYKRARTTLNPNIDDLLTLRKLEQELTDRRYQKGDILHRMTQPTFKRLITPSKEERSLGNTMLSNGLYAASWGVAMWAAFKYLPADKLGTLLKAIPAIQGAIHTARTIASPIVEQRTTQEIFEDITALIDQPVLTLEQRDGGFTIVNREEE